MKINQRPTPPNEWLYKATIVTNPETGESEEQRTDWCTQHKGNIPDNVPPTEWHEYFYRECTNIEKEEYEKAWNEAHPVEMPSEEPTADEEVEP